MAQKEVTKGHVACSVVLGLSFMTAENTPSQSVQESKGMIPNETMGMGALPSPLKRRSLRFA